MPGFQIHIAVGKRYIKKHRIENTKDFLRGTIAPDFVEDKSKSHYTRKTSKNTLKEYLKNKVDINTFLEENRIDTDYKKGVFLHLLTDKLFFTEFFSDEYINNVDYKTFVRDLYTSYNETNSCIERKYDIHFDSEIQKKMQKNIQESRKEKKMDEEKGKNIIPINKLENFIETVSDIDLNEYIKNK